MDDLQLNISVTKSHKKKIIDSTQKNASEYKFISKPNFTGKTIARKRPQNLTQKHPTFNSDKDEPARKITKTQQIIKPTQPSHNKSDDLSINLRDLSENKGKYQGKNYQELSDHIQIKQKPKGTTWISSLFKNNPEVPRIGQRAVKPIVEKVFTSKTFEDLDIHPHSIANLKQNLKLTELMTVQQSAIPVILQGRDVLIRSQTGSGKTLAYALPVIEGLQAIRPKINRFDGIRVIVVVPTRELAVQTYELFVKLVKPFTWIVPGLLSGGQKRKAEKARLRKGLSILVGTPGRINDHLRHTKSLNFSKTGCLILDEADRLLDMGYEKDVAAIVKAIEDHKKAATYDPMAMVKQTITKKSVSEESENVQSIESPENMEENVVINHHLTEIFLSTEHQTILLSATLSKAVENLAGITMMDPVFVDTSEGRAIVADSLKVYSNNDISDTHKKGTKYTPDVETPKADVKVTVQAKKAIQVNLTDLHIETNTINTKSPVNMKETHEESDSDSDYEYFKVQKEIEEKNTKIENVQEEKKPLTAINTFTEAVKSAVGEDELVLPASVNQTFLIVPMKLRLVTLCALIMEHCVLNKKGGKMIVFMATLEMVDYHSELIETVLTGMDQKTKKKRQQKSDARKRKLEKKANEKSNAESSSDSEYEVDYEEQMEGALLPVDFEMFSLHGSMPHEQRIEVFKQFRTARSGVLICTDVAARGLDVPRVDLVLQYCAPASATDYVHRVGRTGRATQVGAAILFLLPSETEFVRHLEQKRIRLRQGDESKSLEVLRTVAPTAGNYHRAAIAVQAKLEHTAHSSTEWLSRASRAFTSWVRFYSGYPRDVREYLDSKQLHLGHAAKAFALRETPAALARRSKSDPKLVKERPVNRLTVHDEEEKKRPGFPKVKIGFNSRVVNKQSSMHTASEFDSGLPPIDNYNKKKKLTKT